MQRRNERWKRKKYRSSLFETIHALLKLLRRNFSFFPYEGTREKNAFLLPLSFPSFLDFDALSSPIILIYRAQETDGGTADAYIYIQLFINFPLAAVRLRRNDLSFSLSRRNTFRSVAKRGRRRPLVAFEIIIDNETKSNRRGATTAPSSTVPYNATDVVAIATKNDAYPPEAVFLPLSRALHYFVLSSFSLPFIAEMIRRFVPGPANSRICHSRDQFDCELIDLPDRLGET